MTSRRPPEPDQPYTAGSAAFYTPEDTGHPNTWEVADRIQEPGVFCGRSCTFKHALKQGVNIEHAEAWTHRPAGPPEDGHKAWTGWTTNMNPAPSRQEMPKGSQVVRQPEHGPYQGFHIIPEEPASTAQRHSEAAWYRTGSGRQYESALQDAHELTHCANCGKKV